MLEAVRFWALAEVIGLLGLPLAAFLFSRLPGGGLALARPLGLLVVAFVPWLLASLGVLRFDSTGAWVGVALLAALSAALWAAMRRGRRNSARREVATRAHRLRLWLVGEVVFAVAFCAWALLRSTAPDVWGTEKPMDMAFINAINRSEWLPPHDPWFAGETLNYYYFGHFLIAVLVRLSAVDSTSGFNLGMALVAALTLASTFAVAASLYLWARVEADAPRRSPVWPGLAAVAFACVLGNVAGGIQWLTAGRRLDGYDWWSPSRVVPDTINEFPFFSFLLGDLHAHVLVVPLTLVAVAFILQLVRAGPRRSGLVASATELGLAALVLGALYATNAWSYPVIAAGGLLGLAVWSHSEAGSRCWAVAGAWALAWLVLSVVAFLPFHRHFEAVSGGIGLVRTHPTFMDFVVDLVLIYGLSAWVIAVLFAKRLHGFGFEPRHLVWLGVLLVVGLVLLTPSRWGGVALVAFLLAFALLAVANGEETRPARALWLIVAMGLGLIVVPEVLYLRDEFDNSALYRMNTVFKLGYQAWYLLAIAAACTLFWSRSWQRGRVRRAWQMGVVALVALSAAYTIAGTWSRSDGFARSPSLDGLRWLRTRAPGDLEAIRWLRAHTREAPVVLESPGRDFDERGYSRVSTFTGLAAPIGWPGHELQWGHDPGQRIEDVNRIYETRDLSQARALLRRYRVRYVFVGSLERADFPAGGLAKFDRLARRVFSRRGTAVFELPPSSQRPLRR